MPFLSSSAASLGYGRAAQSAAVDPTNPIVSGNATTSMSTTGATAISGVAGQDDAFGAIPTDSTFPFYFFGSNYGSGAVSPNGMYWNTNNVFGFGTGNNTITWTATTGRGILMGNADRRTDPNAWYFPITTSGNYVILRVLVFFRNIYSAGVAGEGQVAVRFARNTVNGKQYVEFRTFKGSGSANSGAITTTGQWNITNGTTFQNTFGSTFNTSFPADNTSYVLSCDSNGSNWTFSNTSYLNI